LEVMCVSHSSFSIMYIITVGFFDLRGRDFSNWSDVNTCIGWDHSKSGQIELGMDLRIPAGFTKTGEVIKRVSIGDFSVNLWWDKQLWWWS
jgi:hypothetical protein